MNKDFKILFIIFGVIFGLFLLISLSLGLVFIRKYGKFNSDFNLEKLIEDIDKVIDDDSSYQRQNTNINDTYKNTNNVNVKETTKITIKTTPPTTLNPPTNNSNNQMPSTDNLIIPDPPVKQEICFNIEIDDDNFDYSECLEPDDHRDVSQAYNSYRIKKNSYDIYSDEQEQYCEDEINENFCDFYSDLVDEYEPQYEDAKSDLEDIINNL